jgi:hypothetical protein
VTTFVTEELVFEQAVGQRRTVDGKEREAPFGLR